MTRAYEQRKVKHTNSLVQLHNLNGGSQVTPNQSRRHHSRKGSRQCIDDELLALVLQKIVSSTLNHSLIDLALIGEGLEWKATRGG